VKNTNYLRNECIQEAYQYLLRRPIYHLAGLINLQYTQKST